MREFKFNANIEDNTKVGCLKFTLKDGTDGWTMEKVGFGWTTLDFQSDVLEASGKNFI